MSAGGYCALNLGLRHRDVVATIVDMSGYTVPTHSGGMAAVFGKAQAAVLTAANSPKVYAAHLPDGGPPTRIWLDSGTDDKTVIRQMAELVPVMQRKGMVVRWQVRSGGHTYWVWRAAVEEALPWAVAGHPGKPAHDPSHPGPAGPL
jgi:enterochelin esterase-like enzyme